MKAPDKIYVREFPQGLNQLWSSVLATQTSAIEQHVYIRKDALLDWIKDQLKENEEWREVNPDDRFFGGKEVAFERLIDKINSLGASTSKVEGKQ
jgi:hypothetical protein